jgi:hypothetical protein
MRGRAEERVTAELGHRTEREIERPCAARLAPNAGPASTAACSDRQDELGGLVDLRPDPSGHARSDRTC